MDFLMYVLIFLLFYILVFRILRAIKIERAFMQGKVFEIQMAYILISMLCSYGLTECIYKFIDFAKNI